MDDITINHEGDVWRVLGVGARNDGNVYLHLASTTKFRKQRNGEFPVQICAWFPESVLNETA